MTIGELKHLIANLSDDFEVFVESECHTLNAPRFQNAEPGEMNFIVLALPCPFDTYWGPK